ncbi:uncharacterized protein [Excalfactoria chinensis]|uniref:uncharacterized protein isoform X2 n=1 Tax=Excalfactoria chinensis TaxID=46218 RepID=UPI003B3A03B7
MSSAQNPDNAGFRNPAWVLAHKEEREKLYLMMSGNIFIRKFLELLDRQQPPEDIIRQYMEKVLHTVFFFGRLNQRQMSPDEFLDNDTFDVLQRKFPLSFQQYSTHLPSLTPYSILLQFGSDVAGCSTREKMENFLREFNKTVENAVNNTRELGFSNYIFKAAVVAYSSYREPGKPQTEASFRLFYGASLSCKGWKEKMIMISILCLRTWHKAVAFAVYHGKDNLAIVFPNEVQCSAFYYKSGAFMEKPPCVNCKNMFQVDFQPYEGDKRKKVGWPYGNCAENECLSKVLHGVPGLQEKITSTHTPPQPNNYKAIEEEFANIIEGDVRNQLKGLLQEKNFRSDLQFFEPQ